MNNLVLLVLTNGVWVKISPYIRRTTKSSKLKIVEKGIFDKMMYFDTFDLVFDLSTYKKNT